MRAATDFLEKVRPTTWRVLTLAIAVCLVLSWLVNFVVGPVGSNVRNALGNVARASGGLVQTPLVVGPFYFAVVGSIIFGIGRLRCSDVGWRPHDVGTGLLVTLGFWGAMQAALAGWVLVTGGQLQWNDAWSASSDSDAGRILGELLAQLLGNALLEEMVFRGFFLPQFYLKASARFRPPAALAIALIGSQLLFAVTHLPTRLFVQEWPVEELLGDQVLLFVKGLTYGAVYLVTRNIFVCVGLHSLWNQPAGLLQMPTSPGVEIVWFALTAILLLAWPLARRWVVVRRIRFLLAGLAAFLLFGAIVEVLWTRRPLPVVQVEPVNFVHPDELVRGDGFLVLADRRVFATMAFLNAAGYDEETAGQQMHPVRVRVRELVEKSLAAHPGKLRAWRKYYKRKPFGTHQYQDFALSLTADYPFKRIRPDDELGYRHTAKSLSDFPEVLNDFWVTAGLADVWAEVSPDYIAEINKYNFERMRRQLAFLYEYLRMERSDSYTIVNVPNLLEAYHIGVGARYEHYYYSVESPGSHDYDLNIHEYLHSIVNPLVKAHFAAHQNKLEKYIAAGKTGPLTKTYQDPIIFTYECLVRALDQRVSIQFDDDASTIKPREDRIARETRDGLTLAQPFYQLLTEFEASDKRFDEFVPVMLDHLPEYAPLE